MKVLHATKMAEKVTYLYSVPNYQNSQTYSYRFKLLPPIGSHTTIIPTESWMSPDLSFPLLIFSYTLIHAKNQQMANSNIQKLSPFPLAGLQCVFYCLFVTLPELLGCTIINVIFPGRKLRSCIIQQEIYIHSPLSTNDNNLLTVDIKILVFNSVCSKIKITKDQEFPKCQIALCKQN